MKKENQKPEEITPEERERIEKKSLPTFPERKKGEDQASQDQEKKEENIPGIDDTLTDQYVLEICNELAEIGGQIWHSIDRQIPVLEPFEKNILAKPLAKVAVKYKVGKYMKDEVVLLGAIIFIVNKRLRIKKNADHDRGEKGEGKDVARKEDNKV